MFSRTEEPKMSCGQKLNQYLSSYWRGIVLVISPILYSALFLMGTEKSMLCGWTMCVMATYWVSEALPLVITALIPIFAFPLFGVMDSMSTCEAYFQDAVVMFLASMYLAYSIELSGLHVRLALCAIRTIGYSHFKLLFALSFITMFISMWITNAAATTLMVPINFAILRVLEEQGLGQVYVTNAYGDKIPADITVCYFCTATYSATIGGIGTLVGTGTNLAFKGLFETEYPKAPEVIAFDTFSMFTVPYMLVMNFAVYFWMIFYYFGFLRSNSKAGKAAALPAEGIAAAKKAVNDQWSKLGPCTFYEIHTAILFAIGMVLFFCRAPTIFQGWADFVTSTFDANPRSKFVRDSAPAIFVVFIMFLLPSSLHIFKYCTAKYKKDVPKGPILSVLPWVRVNSLMPYGFCFLLGAGFALSKAANETGLSKVLAGKLSALKTLPSSMVVLLVFLFTVFLTHFASNVAVANIVCPVAMNLANVIKMNPLWLCLVSGIGASFCFLLPVGTPGNLIVQSATNMPTIKMVEAGSGAMLLVTLISWFFMTTYINVIWTDLDTVPDWANVYED